MGLQRKHDWQAELDRYLLDHRTERFAYGSWDCCLFVCGAIEAMTGTDLASEFRGLYHSHGEAVQVVRAFAGRPSIRVLVDKVTARNGMRPVFILQAQRGDVVMIRRGKRDYSLGLVGLSGHQAIVAGRSGLLEIPVTRALQGWRV